MNPVIRELLNSHAALAVKFAKMIRDNLNLYRDDRGQFSELFNNTLLFGVTPTELASTMVPKVSLATASRWLNKKFASPKYARKAVAEHIANMVVALNQPVA